MSTLASIFPCSASRLLSRAAIHLLILLTGLLMSTASAHNVVSGVYADGMLIEGEIGFSNGDMAEAGSPVKVFNEADELIAELVLDEFGAFSYQAKTVAKHVFKANLSAGHVAKMVIEANELTAPMGGIVTQNAPLKTKPQKSELLEKPSLDGAALSGPAPSNNSTLSSNITVEQLQTIVRSAVVQQVRPLQKELKAYKEKVMFRDITGGLGFIFGLFGVAAWMASRRKDPLKDLLEDKAKEGEKNATVS